ECFPILSTLIQDDCFYDIAQKKKSDLICNLITTEIRQGSYYRDECNMEIFDTTKDAALCSKIIDANLSNHCFIRASEGNANYEACQKIVDVNAFDSCIGNVAQSSKNYIYCNEMNFESHTVDCLQQLADANHSSLELCQSFPDRDQRYDCIFDMAIKTKVSGTCNNILENFSLRDDCVNEIAVATNNPNLCSDYWVKDYNRLDGCYSSIAISKLDLELCKKIHAGKPYIRCFGNIAIEIEDIDLCNNIDKNFPTEKYDSANQCRYQYATHFLNKALCEKILHPILREECEDAI
ncbi:MAG: hypothetical protein ABID38_04815, partial [Candidatus Diapherotrites archaeon]